MVDVVINSRGQRPTDTRYNKIRKWVFVRRNERSEVEEEGECKRKRDEPRGPNKTAHWNVTSKTFCKSKGRNLKTMYQIISWSPIINTYSRLKLETRPWKSASGHGYYFSIWKKTCIAKRKRRYDYCYIFRAIPIVTMDFTYDRSENVVSYVHSIVNMEFARKM